MTNSDQKLQMTINIFILQQKLQKSKMCDNPSYIAELDEYETPPPTYTSRRELIVQDPNRLAEVDIDDNDENDNANGTQMHQSSDKWVELEV